MNVKTSPIRIVIADDQELIRTGFSMVINSQTDMEVAGHAQNGDEAVKIVRELKPDIVLMDVRMPGMNGIEAAKMICSESDALCNAEDCQKIRTRVIILTTFDLDEYVMSAINAGASGFLLKDTKAETLLNSIRSVYEGDAIIAPSATRRMIERMIVSSSNDAGVSLSSAQNRSLSANNIANPVADNAENPSIKSDNAYYFDKELESLTDREKDVLIEIAHGLNNREIAEKLFISLPTVKTHVAHILKKINARDRVQAVVFAYENHMI